MTTDRGDAGVATTLRRYLSSKIVRQLLGAVTAFLRPRLLSPELFGVWTMLRLIPQFSAYAHLGLRNTLRIYDPWHRSRGEHEAADALVDVGLIGGLMIDLLLALAILVIAWAGDWSWPVRAGLSAMAAVVVLQGWHHSLFAALKARNRFDLIAKTNYLESGLIFVCTLALLPTLGIYGVFLALLITELAVVRWLNRRAGVRPRWRPGLPRGIGGMIARGWRIMGLELMMLLVVTADRLLVSAWMGVEAVGYYGVAALIVSFLRNVPGTAREVMEPRLMAELARDDRAGLLQRHVLEPLMNSAFLMPLLIGPAVLAAPLAVRWVLPGYEAAVVPTQVLACGIYFLALSLMLRSAVVAFGHQGRAMLLLPAVLAAQVGFSWLGWRVGLGLAGFALGSGLGFLLMFLLYACVLRAEMASVPRSLRRELAAIWPMFAVSTLLPWALLALPMELDLLGTGVRVIVSLVVLAGIHRAAASRLSLLAPLSLAGLGVGGR